jgi:hypothetical protein
MLRSTPAQPGSVSKHAQHPMQRILVQPLSFARHTDFLEVGDDDRLVARCDAGIAAEFSGTFALS